MKLKWISILFLLFLASCGGDKDDISNAIDEANFLLTTRNCAQARTVLDQVGYQASNPRYIAAYATTYACEANYSTVNFFADDLGNLSGTANGFLGSIAAFSTSNRMTSATDVDFTKLQQAINTILYAGSITDSSSANRIATFGAADATNLHAQALYMVLVNLGRWLRYHGNTDSLGNKGSGTNPEANTCLYPYNDADANIITALSTGNTGPCTVGNVSSTTDINTGDVAVNQERLCNGILLFNNFVDLILNLTFSSANAGNLSALSAEFETLCTSIGAINTALCSMRDMDDCKAADPDELALFSAYIFENALP